jgi:nitronate monooxygenase
MEATELLGVEIPIIQAPMAGVQGSDLAMAVRGAGGLGSLPCAMLSPGALHDELTAIRAGGRGAVNVNFFCHTPPTPDAAAFAAWLDLLAPYYEEFGVAVPEVPLAAQRLPFGEQSLEVLREFKPDVVSFHFGLPDAAFLDEIRSWGTKILSSATSVAEAEWLAASGVDAVIAQGLEAGGHRGMFLSDDLGTQVGTMALVPQVVGAINIPVIAAGGIADARGVKAALALGAIAAQVGTAYLLCPEATTSDVHRAALASPQAQTTAITNLFSGRPARSIVNRLIRDLGPMNPSVPAFPLALSALTPLRAAAADAGSGDFTALWAGQSASRCRSVGAAVVTRELAGV